MPKNIQTKRLLMNSLTLEDFADLRLLHSNIEVMKHITGQVRTEEQTTKGLNQLVADGLLNTFLGQWMVRLRDSNEFIGSYILRNPATVESTEGIEIGFSFLPHTWGKGYATEATQAVIDYAKRENLAQRIIGLVDPHNPSSRRVLEKAGMVKVGETVYLNSITGDSKVTDLFELYI